MRSVVDQTIVMLNVMENNHQPKILSPTKLSFKSEKIILQKKTLKAINLMQCWTGGVHAIKCGKQMLCIK